jgi:hypothetical protein
MLSRRVLAGVVRAAARRTAYPCWFRVIGGIRVLAVLGLAVSRPVVSGTDRKQPEHGYTDCTVTTRICSGCATEHVFDPMVLHSLFEQHNSDASVRCDGPSHAERLIRVGSV